jgi:hypothetical protein
LAVLALELVGVPDGLVEERRDALGVGLGALAVVNSVGVGHVVHVVVRVELAVPARGEEELGTDALGAVLVEELLVGEEMAVHGRLGRLLVVQAVHADGLEAQVLLRRLLLVEDPLGLGPVGEGQSEVALVGVTGQHLEARREGLDLLALVLDEEVVCEHTADLRDHLGCSILVDEVESRCPEKC